MVFGVSDDSELPKEPVVAAPSANLIFPAPVVAGGLFVLLYATPLSIKVAPPSSVTLPPLVAVL